MVFCRSKSSEPGLSRLQLELETHVREGRVTKEVFLREGHPVVYQRHTVEGFVGPTSVGHHAILAMPDDQGRLQSPRALFTLV